ncbi:MAG: helix-turn-helix domain-containing protein [Thiohalobacterales bacterium]|nr:helix-turn-helix domain-containing protein [Thiohalobacterales bacterium]
MSEGQVSDAGLPEQAAGSGSIGERLRAARARRNLTIETVASKLRLDATIVEALESNDADRLPAPIFVQGYLRSYARLLELPEDELVSDYMSGSGDLPPLTVNRLPGRKKGLRLPSMRILRNIILLLLAAILVWLAYPYLGKMLDIYNQPEEQQSPGYLEIPPVNN